MVTTEAVDGGVAPQAWDARSQRETYLRSPGPWVPGGAPEPALGTLHSCPSWNLGVDPPARETGTLRKEALLGPGIWCRSSRADPPSCPPGCQSPCLQADQLISLDSPPPFLDRQGRGWRGYI